MDILVSWKTLNKNIKTEINPTAIYNVVIRIKDAALRKHKFGVHLNVIKICLLCLWILLKNTFTKLTKLQKHPVSLKLFYS